MTAIATDEITFQTAPCSYGRVQVAATDRGICAVTLGDDDHTLIDGLAESYPDARVQPGTSGELDQYVDEVLAAMDGSASTSFIPLDLRGTPFELRVWRALRKIPRGTTITYSLLADQLRVPGAVRAVGTGMWKEPHRGPHPVPPRNSPGRVAGWLSLGR